MKILVVSHMLPYPPHTGAMLRIHNLLRQAAKQHEVHLVTLYQRSLHPRDDLLEAGRRAVEQYCESVEVFAMPSDAGQLRWGSMLAANLLSPLPVSVSRFASAPMVEAVGRVLKRVSFDVIQIETIALAPYTMQAEGVPRVAVHHNVESSLLERRSRTESNPLARWYLAGQARKLRRYEREQLTGFDLNIAVSADDQRGLQELAPGARVEVVPNGTDTDYFAPRTSGEQPTLVFAGTMGWYPNTDAMLYFCREVFPRIREQVPGVEMNVIGSSPGEELKNIAASEPGINVLGFVDDVRDHIGSAAVYVVPLRVGGGTRLKILDAMAMGKAVVSTSIGAEGLQLEDGKQIVIADDADSFADATVALLRDPERRQRIATDARTMVCERFSWDVVGPTLVELYRSLERA